LEVLSILFELYDFKRYFFSAKRQIKRRENRKISLKSSEEGHSPFYNRLPLLRMGRGAKEVRAGRE
jgi:hypothetical protein